MYLGYFGLFPRFIAGFSVLIVFIFLGVTSDVFAGFGITPPYVINDRLTRGTEFEQVINVVRSDPDQDLMATITMNIPGVEAWFSVDKGNEFLLPKGQTQVPMAVIVRVPEDAPYERHKGTIRIRTAPIETPDVSGVSIALGAQIDVDVEVVDKILDFSVRRIRINDLEEGRKKWGLFFPAKIKFFMTIENTGNADFGPTKVAFDIYDANGEQLLERVENTNTISLIKPFAIEEVTAELPTRLAKGRYIAKYTIYKEDDIAQQGEVTLSVASVGAIPGYEGYGFGGLSLQEKLLVIGVLGSPFVLLFLVLVYFFLRRRAYRRRLKHRRMTVA